MWSKRFDDLWLWPMPGWFVRICNKVGGVFVLDVFAVLAVLAIPLMFIGVFADKALVAVIGLVCLAPAVLVLVLMVTGAILRNFQQSIADRRYDQAALRETNKLSVRLLMKADVNHEFVYARLRPEELVMWDALTFWSDLRMGGLEHCLEFHGSRAAQMLDALEAIGAVNARAGLQQACELFASGMPGADSETRRAEMRNIDKKHGGRAIDEIIRRTLPKGHRYEDVPKLVLAYRKRCGCLDEAETSTLP